MDKLNICFKLLCLIGFVYQMTHISLEYFSFKTNTKVTLVLHAKSANPSIIFCTHYTDILDRTDYQRYGIHQERSFNFTEMLSDHTKLTIRDIFDLTPHPNKTMIGCQIREHDHNVQTYPLDQCYSMFHIRKFHEGAFICYQFRTRIVDSNFRCHEASLSYHSNTELYLISLDRQFLLSNAIKVISFIPQGIQDSFTSFPFESRRFFESTERYTYDAPETSKMNQLFISAESFFTTRLGSPYDTDCAEEFEKTETFCRRRCNIASFSKHGIFPPNEFCVKPLPIKHLNVLTMENKTLFQDVQARNEECMKMCNRKGCHEWYSVTNLKAVPYKLNATLSIVSSCSNKPTVIIQYLPRITFMELFMYVSSSLGIWFGISVLSINPFQVNRYKLTKQRIAINKTDVTQMEMQQ